MINIATGKRSVMTVERWPRRPNRTAARTVLTDFMMRRRQTIAAHRARPPSWPDNIIGHGPRPGDRRTPAERWRDFHFRWENHFHG
jgi:hypothetical protein